MLSTSIQQLEINVKRSPIDLADKPSARFFINGKDAEGTSNVTKAVEYPHDPAVLVGSCFQVEERQVPWVLEAAQVGFERFRKTSRGERVAILTRLAEQIAKNSDILANLITLESGKPISLSRQEVLRAQALCLDYAEELSRYSPKTLVIDKSRTARLELFPIGPVLAITPFNFPLNLVMHKLAPAIAAGCSIVLKPAPQTPLTALKIGQLAKEAGYDAFSVIPTSNEVAEQLVKSHVFRKVSFTGSANVGWHLRKIAGPKAVTLELGGNAAVIIEDLHEDPEEIAERVAFGAFANAGQICIAVQRILVRQELMAEFVPHLVEASRKIRVGDPMKDDTVVGPMINLDAVQEARMILRDAVSKGGNVLYGGNTYNLYSMTPTLIDRIRPDMRIAQEECFAPLATVEPYETLPDAMAKVNASPFGLQAGIYTADPQKIEFAYQMLDVGTVISNDIPTYRCDKLPYGGVKLSGLGREGVMAGIVSMSVEKPLVLNS